jgi:hypothetical protein
MVLAKRSGQIFTVNADIELIPSPCKGALENLIGTVRAELHIVSPYVTDAGTALITNRLKTSARRSSIAVQLLTDLNPLSVCQGSCDPQAILHMTRSFPRARITHLPRMHAKIMIADRAVAHVLMRILTAGTSLD